MNNSVELKDGIENIETENPVLKFLKSVFKGKPSLEKRRARAGYVFVLPFILGVLLIYLPLLIDSVWLSMSEVNAANKTITFVGFEHYVDAFSTSGFTAAFLAGLQQLIFEVPAIIVFSLFIAVVLNNKMLGRAAFRAIFFLPVIVSTGIMETLNAADAVSSESGEGINDGTQNNSAEIISMLDVQQLFASMKVGGELVTYVVDLVNNVYNIINYSGVQMLIFLAGLQSISPSIYEACQIEGATGWETFWKITFPMISPMILVNAIYTVIDSFTRSTNPAMAFIRRQFDGGSFSSATAMSWMYFLVVALVLVVVAAIVSSFVFYQRRD
ncbi:MAG: sugar ABC transporter permease [Clostridia bacterium]|nr:sugar ABC transporter permease [Clostridia bacterium]MBO5206521.1 sugar ABC transporter permease [Clostridia bacterium]MBP3583012.1 sugar ABC transporter permease [Clostridia bacterium]MBQ8583740.1 sugar ABC transporter permease [Clostridia bacterium]